MGIIEIESEWPISLDLTVCSFMDQRVFDLLLLKHLPNPNLKNNACGKRKRFLGTSENFSFVKISENGA